MNSTRKKCAYCGSETKLTREHVVPNFLYKQNPQAKFGYNPKGDKFMTWEAQVKDVCANCNNHPLSEVDSYAMSFLQENRINEMITEEKTFIVITYDYSWLSRVLLKIIFNFVRFKGEDTGWIENFRRYILYGTDFPPDYRMKIGIEVVPCHKITEEDRARLPEESKDWVYLPPQMIRIGKVYGAPNDDVFARYVSVNNFYFYCIVGNGPGTAGKIMDTTRRLCSACPSVTFLQIRKTSVMLRVSNTYDDMDKYLVTATVLYNKWAEYLKKHDSPNNM